MYGEERLAVGVMMGITMTADGDLYSFALYFALDIFGGATTRLIGNAEFLHFTFCHDSR
jgi:hypothetical protein